MGELLNTIERVVGTKRMVLKSLGEGIGYTGDVGTMCIGNHQYHYCKLENFSQYKEIKVFRIFLFFSSYGGAD